MIIICLSVFGGVRDAVGWWMDIGENSGLTGADDVLPCVGSCTMTSCNGWMQSSSSDISSDTNSRRSFNSKRDLTSTIDLANFFLTTGLAALCSFWLMTYTFLFTFYRFCSSIPSNGARGRDGGGDGEQEDEDTDEKGRRLTRWRRMKRSLKRFAFRVSRIYVFMLGWIVFGVACAASWQVKVASSDGGSVGTGVLCKYRFSFLVLFCLTKDQYYTPHGSSSLSVHSLRYRGETFVRGWIQDGEAVPVSHSLGYVKGEGLGSGGRVRVTVM